MKNLKDIYKDKTLWNQYVEDQANRMMVELPVSGVGCFVNGFEYLKDRIYKDKSGFKMRTFCYGDFQHNDLENIFGITWNGPEREEWMKDVKTCLLKKCLSK